MDIDDIGIMENALLCHTNKTDCCDNPHTRAGEWYYPNGEKVGIQSRQEEFYRNRGMQLIRLNRRKQISEQRGRFRCEIPDAKNNSQSVYAYIGMLVLWYCRIVL